MKTGRGVLLPLSVVVTAVAAALVSHPGAVLASFSVASPPSSLTDVGGAAETASSVPRSAEPARVPNAFKEWVAKRLGLSAVILFFPPNYPLTNPPPLTMSDSSPPASGPPPGSDPTPVPPPAPPPPPVPPSPPGTGGPEPGPPPPPPPPPPPGGVSLPPPTPGGGDSQSTPEPATLLSGALGCGLIGLYGLCRRRKG